MAERMTKWDGRAHWSSPMTYLGEDAYGQWLGSPPGVLVSRPGASFVAKDYCAKLVAPGRAFVANFNGPATNIRIYVDMATPPTLDRTEDGWAQHAIDLDLDVILRRDGSLVIDDEDEFDEHQRSYGYPDDVVAMAQASCAEVHAAIRDGEEPFATVGFAWLDRAEQLFTGAGRSRPAGR